MKILHINSYYNSGKFYKNLYEQQIKSRLDIDVFVPMSKSNHESDFDYGNYTTISKNYNIWDRYIFHLKHYKILMDVLKRYNIKNYSVIHAHSLFSNGYIAMKLKEKFGIPYIVAVRDTDVNTFFKKMIHLRKLGNKILLEADSIIFLSASYRDNVIEKYVSEKSRDQILEKSYIIPNGIDSFWLENVCTLKSMKSSKAVKILYVGDISKRKNVLTTVKAIEILKNKGYEVKFTIVGKIISEKIYNKVKNNDYIEYISPKSKEELLEIYRGNDIFVMPSITETFGLVYAEAMSQGLPVIYSRGQGFDSQFNEGEIGYSVNCYDHIEISEKIIRIILEYDNKSANIVNSIDKFKWVNITNNYIHLYNGLIND